MKKISQASRLLFAGILAVAFLSLHPLAAAAAISGPVVFIVPHQDDELISMGAGIEAHVATGREIYIVQVSDGRGTGAFKLINERLAKEKRKPITRQELSFARDREQLAALKVLGIKPQNVFHESLYNEQAYDSDGLYFSDGEQGSTEKYIKLIDKYVKKFPNASFKTMSWLDAHSDHYRLGYALNARCTHGKNRISDCRFFQSPLYQVNSKINTTQDGKPIPKIETPKSYTVRGSTKLSKAIDEYKVWNPSAGRYSVGNISVAAQLKYVQNTLQSKYHMSDHYYDKNDDVPGSLNWIKQYQNPSYVYILPKDA